MPRSASLSPRAQRRPSITQVNSGGPAGSSNNGAGASTRGPQFFFVVASGAADSSSSAGLESVSQVVESLNRKAPPSCDACRTRKIKCSGRPAVIELGPEVNATVPCDHCKQWDLDCSYLYQRKRRGRKNRVVERLAEEQRARRESYAGGGGVSASNGGGGGGGVNGSGSGSGTVRAEQTRQDPMSSESDEEQTMGRRGSFEGFNLGSLGNDYPMAMPSGSSQIHNHTGVPHNNPLPTPLVGMPPMYHHHSQPIIPSYEPSNPYRHSPPEQPAQNHSAHPNTYSFPGSASSTGTLSHHPPHSASQTQTQAQALPHGQSHQEFNQSYHSGSIPGPNSTSPNNEVSPSLALSEASVPPTTSIESILPRDLAMLTIHLYFEHVYCIIPVIHKPSFNADLLAHEEERRPMFFALIMAVIAATLIHVPKSYFPIPAESVRRLSDRCLKACYAVTRREMDIYGVDLVCIKYLVFVVHNKHGNVAMEASAFGEAQYLSISLGLHREDTYYNLDPIEAERRRRVWFLIYNADKFEAVARIKPVLLRSDEFMGTESTAFPSELDDKSITATGFLPSSNPVPLICGFNTLTRIVTILGDILVHERDIRRQNPTEPEDLLAALRQVRKLQQRIKGIADSLPRPFQLEVGSGEVLPAPGWEDAIRDELDLFFSDPTSSETAKDGYLVLKANIHVTLAMTRLRLILHREDLLSRSGQPGTPSRNAAELVAADLGENVDWRQSVYRDLFKAVHGIPIQALAANGPSIVTKIRVVAVTLFDALPAQDQTDPNVQGIAAYLLDFLTIMTSIESQFAD
ncbi:hypothetical protein IAT38_007840 [Cryptococcus sp. DSM 104549]